jgi:hypothetical protein
MITVEKRANKHGTTYLAVYEELLAVAETKEKLNERLKERGLFDANQFRRYISQAPLSWPARSKK